MPTLFAYIVRYDDGYAPNPSNDICTLAYCKCWMRPYVQKGDYVVGLGKKQLGNRPLVYAMMVTEVMEHDCYLRDERFKERWGDYDNANAREEIAQSSRVLISKKQDFTYWGGEGPVPDDLRFLQQAFERSAIFHRVGPPGPGRRKCSFTQEQVDTFVEWFNGRKEHGCVGLPTNGKRKRSKTC